MTLPTQAVLQAMLGAPSKPLYGFELSKASGLASGTIYPILQRLEAAGWVWASWEPAETARAAGRPARRYYELSGVGRTRAVDALDAAADQRKITTDLLIGRTRR